MARRVDNWGKKLLLHDTLHDFLGSRLGTSTENDKTRDNVQEAIQWAVESYAEDAGIGHVDYTMTEAHLMQEWFKTKDKGNPYDTSKAPISLADAMIQNDPNYMLIDVVYVDDPEAFIQKIDQLAGAKQHPMFITDVNAIGDSNFCSRVTRIGDNQEIQTNNIITVARAYDKNVPISQHREDHCFKVDTTKIEVDGKQAEDMFMNLDSVTLSVDNNGSLVVSYQQKDSKEPHLMNLSATRQNNLRHGLPVLLRTIEEITRGTQRNATSIRRTIEDFVYDVYRLPKLGNRKSREEKVKYIQTLMDFKRMGDFLQVYFCKIKNAKSHDKKYIFVSNDRIPCLYADWLNVPAILTRKTKRKEGMLHGNRQMILFGFESSIAYMISEVKNYVHNYTMLKGISVNNINSLISYVQNEMNNFIDRVDTAYPECDLKHSTRYTESKVCLISLYAKTIALDLSSIMDLLRSIRVYTKTNMLDDPRIKSINNKMAGGVGILNRAPTWIKTMKYTTAFNPVNISKKLTRAYSPLLPPRDTYPTATKPKPNPPALAKTQSQTEPLEDSAKDAWKAAYIYVTSTFSPFRKLNNIVVFKELENEVHGLIEWYKSLHKLYKTKPAEGVKKPYLTWIKEEEEKLQAIIPNLVLIKSFGVDPLKNILSFRLYRDANKKYFNKNFIYDRRTGESELEVESLYRNMTESWKMSGGGKRKHSMLISDSISHTVGPKTPSRGKTGRTITSSHVSDDEPLQKRKEIVYSAIRANSNGLIRLPGTGLIPKYHLYMDQVCRIAQQYKNDDSRKFFISLCASFYQLVTNLIPEGMTDEDKDADLVRKF